MPKWVNVLGAAVVVVALASACASDSSTDSSDRDGDGNLTGSGDVSVHVLQVGDCFSRPADGEVTQVGGVLCDQAHDSEVFARLDMEGGDEAEYPGDAAVQAASEDCAGSPFAEYVGIDFADSRFTATSFNPTQESWDNGGDRTITCFAFAGDHTQVTGSIQDLAE